MRVEWVKGRARALRWTEEVSLLKEEMRRVLVSLEYTARWWEGRAEPWDCIDVVLAEGIRAYALRQASIQRALADKFRKLWAAPLARDPAVSEPGENADGEDADDASGEAEDLNIIEEEYEHDL